VDEFDLELPEVPPIPAPIGADVDEAMKAFKARTEDAARVLVLESQLRFSHEATRIALDDLNKQLDSANRSRAAATTTAGRERKEASALAEVLGTILDLMHVEKPEDMTPERAGMLLTAQKNAREVLKLYWECHE
jgi:hypothetical protein